VDDVKQRGRRPMKIALEGWDINRFEAVEWMPWGSRGDARAKVLGTGDGYFLSLVEADEGYRGDPHVHANTEFLFVVEGTLRNQGQVMTRCDGYAAAIGSSHDDFEVGPGGATYLSIFKV
jgi:mannose-6-phosphate isomerase-like protein (cupin superfamily)